MDEKSDRRPVKRQENIQKDMKLQDADEAIQAQELGKAWSGSKTLQMQVDHWVDDDLLTTTKKWKSRKISDSDGEEFECFGPTQPHAIPQRGTKIKLRSKDCIWEKLKLSALYG